MMIAIVTAAARRVDGDVDSHPVALDQLMRKCACEVGALLGDEFSGQSENPLASRASVFPIFRCLGRVPKRRPVAGEFASTRRCDDFCQQDAAASREVEDHRSAMVFEFHASAIGGRRHGRASGGTA